MGSSIRPIEVGLGTRVAPLLDALARFCDAEGLVTSDLHSIQFLEDEIEVVIVRADGTRRHNIYPMAALWSGPIRGTSVPLVECPTAPPETEHR